VPSLKERCIRRLEGMKALRQPYESEVKEIASYCQPARSRFLTNDTNKGRQPNRRLNNSHGIRAFRTLQGGMTSGLSSESRPWMNLGSQDDELMEIPEIKAYWAEVERLMYLFLARTNFYGAAKTGYLEMGLFGTEACVMAEHLYEGAVCHQLTFGEYWIALDDALKPGALYRIISPSVVQAVQRFGYNNVSQRIRDAYDRSDKEMQLEFYQAIEKNEEQEPGRLDWRGKPWRSVYWDAQDGNPNSLLEQKGCEEQPFWAPRWDTTGNDAWGQGPGHDALPDLRELQLHTKRGGEAEDFLIHPEKVVSSKVKLKGQPKSVVSVASVDNVSELVSIPYEVPYQVLGLIGDRIERTEQKIDEMAYADLFMAITNMQGIQPRNMEEIASRNEEKLTQLGPVIERVNNEKLEVAIDRAFGIMQRGRLLPPAPDALQDSPEVKIDFVSILTQMQRMVGLGPIERTIGFVGANLGMFPGIRHKIDENELVDEYARRAGTPPKIIRSTDEANELADQEAQAAQAAAAAEAAPKVAAASVDMVDAGRLAAETAPGVEGVSAIEALL